MPPATRPARPAPAGVRAPASPRPGRATTAGAAATAVTPPAPPPAPTPAEACAAEVLDVVPTVMDALRVAMRGQLGETWSVPQFRCLNFIGRTPGSSIGEAAAYLGVSMPTASALVDRLVRAGAVEPRACASDRRRTQLHLTDTGRVQLRRIERGAREELQRALMPCSADELLALRAGLAVLRGSFQPA